MSALRWGRGRAALAAGAVSLLTLAGCGNGGSSGGNADGEVGGEVRMLVNLTPNLDQSYWEELVAPFEEATGVSVEIEAPTGSSVAESFPQQLAAGTAPDVIQSIFPDDDTLPQLVDLSDLPWTEGTPMVDDYAIDGSRYVVGVGSQTQSLVFYNKTAFEEAGIAEPPATWAEFTEALGLLDEAGYTPLQTAGQFQTGLQLQQLYHPTLNTVHPRWQTSVADEELSAGEAYLPMFQHYADWLEAGYIAQDDVGLDPAAADGAFLEGTVGLYPQGSWFATTLKAGGEPPFEVGVFSPPVDEGQEHPGPQGATMAYPYMINAASGNISSAQALVEYLVTDEAAIQSQLTADGVFRQGAETADDPVLAQVQAILDEAPGLVAVGEGFGDTRLPVTGFNPKFTEIVQGLYTGQSPQEAADALDDWVSENR
ncbi:ABC transporter substrate-binding protein [Streptomyces johnsoniae]|uniref:Extracellular solute-binding protein n=1 Tax=Streptomyces johnsoniae TaxID=3075532 RepID=A0ABU2S6U6_9ACTN|nr:extracellular solute-binding protein [Streptomyces sp. DSM 41886]MDT0444702.1 extracellular solute-binding protein [Streptomyces sp. DSM 41886]